MSEQYLYLKALDLSKLIIEGCERSEDVLRLVALIQRLVAIRYPTP